MGLIPYAISEGLRLSWQGAALGGVVGATTGYAFWASDFKGRFDRKNLCVEEFIQFILIVALGSIGVVGGVGSGLAYGTARGGFDWATKNISELNSPYDLSVCLGIAVTAGTAYFYFTMPKENLNKKSEIENIKKD